MSTSRKPRPRPSGGDSNRTVFWHRELPPLDAEAVEEHTVEAVSASIKGSLSRGEHAWERAYDDLMQTATDRIHQEVVRLEGDFAHVVDESIDSRHNDGTGKSWLHGRFDYVLYRRTKT